MNIFFLLKVWLKIRLLSDFYSLTISLAQKINSPIFSLPNEILSCPTRKNFTVAKEKGRYTFNAACSLPYCIGKYSKQLSLYPCF